MASSNASSLAISSNVASSNVSSPNFFSYRAPKTLDFGDMSSCSPHMIARFPELVCNTRANVPIGACDKDKGSFWNCRGHLPEKLRDGTCTEAIGNAENVRFNILGSVG